MNTHATATFEETGWDEKTWEGQAWNEQTGAKLTHAVVPVIMRGDIEGESTIHYLMSYHEDESVRFIGLQRVVGRIGKRSGSFVLQIEGSFANNLAKSTFSVVPGSGTGELKGLRGTGEAMAGHDKNQRSFTLDYHFETQAESKVSG